MPPNEMSVASRSGGATSQIFTLADANRALVLVRKIVADIVVCYHQLMQIRSLRQAPHRFSDQLALDALAVPGQDLKAQAEYCVTTLTRLHRELLDVGCVLKDWRYGLVDFPALRDGRRIWLCWRLGESTVSHWHELHAGARGRRPIDDRFA